MAVNSERFGQNPANESAAGPRKAEATPSLRGGRLAGPGNANPSSTAASLPRKQKGRLGANARTRPTARRDKPSANRREPPETSTPKSTA